MCDYSLEHVKSRAANVGDKLVTARFPTCTTGFVSPEDADAGVNFNSTAVCVLPGTEIAFDQPIATRDMHNAEAKTFETNVAVFTQIDPDMPFRHHDALELVTGERILLNDLAVGLVATVLQLPKQTEVSHIDLPAASEAKQDVAIPTALEMAVFG